MSTPSIEQLDRNFLNAENLAHLEWLDAFDSRLAICGLGWREEAYRERSFCRFPARLLPGLPSAVQSLAKAPSSVYLAFRSDASDLSIRLRTANTGLMMHMPATGSAGAELLMEVNGEWLPVRMAVPPVDQCYFERPLLEKREPKMRRFRIYLPLYRGLEEATIGINPGAVIEPDPAPAGSRPTVYYGTSITQGGCASTTASDFVSLLGMRLGTEMINLGFSGNGKGEAVVAEAIAEIEAEMVVLDYVANATFEVLVQTLPGFYAILRERHPAMPIVLQTKIGYHRVLYDREFYREERARREYMMRFYLQARDAGDEHLYFIDGEGALPHNTVGATVDGVHPTTAGFIQMADRLAPQLRTIRYLEGLI